VRQQLEPLIRQEEEARLRRLAIDRLANPPAFARADSVWTNAYRQLSAAVREALRETGLLREAGRALRGTGYTVARFPLEDGTLRIELVGGPDTPVEFLHLPSATDQLRTLLDEFYATTGLEVRMPDELLS
jgi:hypothetical protein